MSMTSDEYVEHKGVRCPNCGSDRVDCDQPSSEGDPTELYSDVECCDCGATWRDTYTLSGFDNLVVPGKESR